jgi:hypothetical protein
MQTGSDRIPPRSFESFYYSTLHSSGAASLSETVCFTNEANNFVA